VPCRHTTTTSADDVSHKRGRRLTVVGKDKSITRSGFWKRKYVRTTPYMVAPRTPELKPELSRQRIRPRNSHTFKQHVLPPGHTISTSPLTQLLKVRIVLHRNSGSELRDVTCHVGSHSVTCHPTHVNAPRLTPAASKLVVDLPTPEGWKAELT